MQSRDKIWPGRGRGRGRGWKERPLQQELPAADPDCGVTLPDFARLNATTATCARRGAHADCVCGLPRTRVVLRAEASGRLVAGFPGGGELFAIASTGRMPLERTAFELVPADDGSPWFSLRHGAQHVVVLPAGAPRGRGMVLLVPPSAVADGNDRFCATRTHLYSAATRGFINLRKQVNLRGLHRGVPEEAGPSGRIALLQVRAPELEADAARWRCKRQSPAARRGTAAGGAAALHVVTYATRATPMLCDALLVNALTGVRITLLGWGETYRGNFQKLRGARSHVGALPPSDLVLFADAYDVLYAADAAAIAARYAALVAADVGGPGRVTFMAERGCWPDWDMALGREWCRRTYPPAPTPYRYVNSGVWLGRADDAHALLADLEAYTPGLDDQHVVSHMFVDEPHRFALDYNATLFQSLQGEHKVKAPAGAAVVNPITRTHPLVVHFNGGAKRQFNSFRDALIAAAPRRCVAADATLGTAGADPLPLATVCPNHALLRQHTCGT